MKKLSLLLLLCMFCMVFGCSLWVRHVHDDQPISESVRTTVITVGNSIRLRNLDFQNLTTTPGGNVTVAVDTLQPSIAFDTYSGQMKWDTATSKLQFSNDDGATWADIGSGSGGTVYQVNTSLQFGNTSGMLRYNGDLSTMQYSNNGGSDWGTIGEIPFRVNTSLQFGETNGMIRYNGDLSTMQYSNDLGSTWADIGSGSGGTTEYALHCIGETNALYLSAASPGVAFMNSSSLQLSVFANLSAILNGVNTNSIIQRGDGNSTYTSNELYVLGPPVRMYWLTRTGASTYVTYSSLVISNFATGYNQRWAEYAIQMNEAGNVTFYLDGNAIGSSAMSAPVYEGATDERLRFLDYATGRIGTVKIGNRLTWPTSGYKGISLEKRIFPGLVFYLPLTEGTGAPSDVISDTALTKGTNVTWEEMTGGF